MKTMNTLICCQISDDSYGQTELCERDARQPRSCSRVACTYAAGVALTALSATRGLLATLALLTGSPFVFPSLGPTAYLFFFSPLAEASSPRNTILGHAIGLVCGYAVFVLTVASSPPFGIPPGIHGPRVLAAALSLSATGALMALFRVSHPPAGATTLIVSLGIISQPKELVIIEVAVVLLTAQAFAINRLAGLPYPLWRHHKPPEAAEEAAGQDSTVGMANDPIDG
jgi:CBS domain-containing membrane protein